MAKSVLKKAIPAASSDPKIAVTLTVNGETVSREASPRMLLSDFIRHELGLTGTHVGCEHGVCGCCTVRLDGAAVRSCILFAVQVDGHRVETVEGLADELPSVGRATLYRTMKLLLEAGVVCKLATMAGSRLFSLSRVDRHHHHSVCVECGAVEEFMAAKVERFLNLIADEIPGEVVDHHLEIYVDCGHCWSGE